MAPSIEDDYVLVEFQDILDFISSYVDSISDLLRPINLKIHDNPELGYHEFIAHETLTAFMKSQRGWKVTSSAYNIPTAFVAVYDTGKLGPVISFNAEYDCLKNIGHACGHNLIATASVAGALAVAAAMQDRDLPGKVVLFGTPAEEGGGGKIKLLNAGAYKDHKVDVSFITHPGAVPDTALSRTSAYQGYKVEYFGREAHAAANPWEGINALDALITTYNALSVLRQQTMPGDVIQGHITNGGSVPNIIHAYASATFVVRAKTKARLDVLRAKAEACFHAGATATGATVKISPGTSYDDHAPNRTMGGVYRKHFNKLGGHIPVAEVDLNQGSTPASTDQGNISYAMPSISAGFWIRSETGPHNPHFAAAARTRESHELALRAAKALAATGVDIITTKGLLEAIKDEFKRLVDATN